MGTDNTQFCTRFCVLRRKVRERNSGFSLRATELGWSSRVGPRLKVGVVTEDYAWIPKIPSFAKVLCGRFDESKALGSGKCSRDFLESLLMLQEVGKFPTRVYFPSRSRFGLG